MNHKELEKKLLAYESTKLDYPFGEEVAVYKVEVASDWKMFALVPEGSDPIRLSLKCDPELARHLREKYESVLEGYHLNKKHWNTILLTGQLSDKEIEDLILHSYNLVTGKHNTVPKID